MKCVEQWIEASLTACSVKFAVYIIFLLIIFVCLWKQMVTNMQMDIIKALGILYILPTRHLRTHVDFIREMNRSSLVN